MGLLMIRVIVLLSVIWMCLAEFVAAVSTASDNSAKYQKYKKDYSKKYKNSFEDNYRLSIYLDNLAKINVHNNNPSNTYKTGINKFSDLTKDEFSKIYLNLRIPASILNIKMADFALTVTTAIDWTNKSAVTDVRDQGYCGSCWAFATVASIESAHLVKSKTRYNFSEQQLVDCSGSYGNGGCDGGLEEWAFAYVKDRGLNLESAYPYKAVDQTCRKNSGPYKISSFAFFSGCANLTKGIQVQPLSVAVDATNWDNYASGIFKNCKSSLNHAVLLVGVTSTYWKIKNSWGTGWGENGFIRLNIGNTCGVCNYPISPTI